MQNRKNNLFTAKNIWASACIFALFCAGRMFAQADHNVVGVKDDLRSKRLVLSEVPLVDLAPLTGQNIDERLSENHELALSVMANDIHYALFNIGFMYVKNHGLSENLINKTMLATREFFDLPMVEKRSLAIEQTGEALHGYTDFFGENTDPGQTRDLKEIFDVGRMARDGGTRRFFGPTPWPSESHPEFQSVMIAYHEEMLSLAHKLMIGLALSLDLPANFFEDMMMEPIGIQRILHYPSHTPLKRNFLDGNVTGEEGITTIGTGAHTDYGCLAILAQDDVGGLQIMNRDGDWVEATPIPGTLVINVGDMIQRLTNDVYVANVHRVVNKSGRDRYSIPFFFDVDYETIIEPLSQFVTRGRPPKYTPIVSGKHKWERYKKSFPHLERAKQ